MVVGEANAVGEMPRIPLKAASGPVVDSDLGDSSNPAIPRVAAEEHSAPVGRSVVLVRVHEPPVQTETGRSATGDGERVILAPEEVEPCSRPVTVDEASASAVELSPQEVVIALREKYKDRVTQIRQQQLLTGRAAGNVNLLQYQRSALCALKIIDNLLFDQLAALKDRAVRDEKPEPKPSRWTRWFARRRAKPVIKWAQSQETKARAKNVDQYWQSSDLWHEHLSPSEKTKVTTVKEIIDATRREFHQDFAELLS